MRHLDKEELYTKDGSFNTRCLKPGQFVDYAEGKAPGDDLFVFEFASKRIKSDSLRHDGVFFRGVILMVNKDMMRISGVSAFGDEGTMYLSPAKCKDHLTVYKI
ncbi:hypothetical protein [Bacillus subtilis]|uniref:hypothetical protein n=1 Tax=Bacillus subtilis TaxID=1423 RepID=UPI0025C77F90|nr:hypothetical protein [Bacillus subtilis]WCS67983.1 hypothetical protein Goe26_00710 [Bacillus phage vB_BsuM-Goe26]GLI90570.1 hypothetical protein ANABIO4_39220 [Bacillus subtilis]